MFPAERRTTQGNANMRAFVTCGAVLWVSVTGAAIAASGSPQSPKLRFTEEYTRYLCEQQKLEDDPSENHPGGDGHVSTEALLNRFEAEERLRERFQSAISNPYPPELQGYKPKGFEFVELHWGPVPCSQEGNWDGAGLPPNFRCRLDRVVLRDQATGKEFLASAALADFDFIYDEHDGRKLEDEPRAVPAQPYKIVGRIALGGAVSGQAYVMSHDWIDGVPAQTVWSAKWSGDLVRLEFARPADVPLVTSSNAALFRFPLKDESPLVQDMYDGPLRAYSFEVHGCQP